MVPSKVENPKEEAYPKKDALIRKPQKGCVHRGSSLDPYGYSEVELLLVLLCSYFWQHHKPLIQYMTS